MRRLSDLRRFRIGRRLLGEHGTTAGIGLRLFASLTITFALVGVVGYVIIDRDLEHRQISEYAAAQQADVKRFEQLGAEAASPADAIHEVDELLGAIARRPGTRETLLVDRHHVIRASGEEHLNGKTDRDRRIDGALLHGRAYTGRESDPGKNHSDFEFIFPAEIAGERYAYEVSYDHNLYQARMHSVRMVLLLVGFLALFGGGGVFYLVGGRALLRDHRIALARATRDGLTDLPNQRAFQDELGEAVASAHRYKDPVALAVLDIDDFKFANDRHGHPHGDTLLMTVAEVLRQARPGDRPYRIGGDEFALLLAHTDAQGARTLTRRLSARFTDVGVEVSIGVSALRPGQRPDALRAESDAALYEAKRQGGHRAAQFDDIREHVAVITSEKKEAVRRLVQEEHLTTVFQPIWNLDAETLLGVEALTRPDPSYGLTGPAEAFDIAEQIGRVHQLDVLCVQSALQSAALLEPGVLLFINISPHTLDLDAEANEWLLAAVEQAGISTQQVVVEVTERFGGRTAAVAKCLQRLRQQGFRTALDDVGTGNSGLDILRSIDADFVKLDRSIVTAAPTEPTARAVLMAMATFARQTGAFVIAEGIEDEETLQFLRTIADHDLHLDKINGGGQGFRLGRPTPEVCPQVPETVRSHAPAA